MTENFDEVSVFNSKEIVAMVTNDVNQIQTLSNKIENSNKAIDKAKKDVELAKKQAAGAKKKADEMEKRGLIRKGKAIDSTQDAVKNLASAQSDLADSQERLVAAQSELAAVQAVTFECQKKIANLAKAMVMVGTTSIANNRILLRELTAKLEGASNGELTELARRELENVVYQIQSQNDLMNEQEELKNIVREHEENIADLEQRNIEQNRQLSEHAAGIRGLEYDVEQQDIQIEELGKENDEQDKKIAENSVKNEEQDAKIAEGIEKDKDQDEKINELDKENDEQDIKIAENATKNYEQDVLLENMQHDICELQNENAALRMQILSNQNDIENLKQDINELREDLKHKSTNILAYISLSIGIVSLLAFLLNYFIF